MKTVLTRQDLKIRRTVSFIEMTTGHALGNAMLSIGEHLIDEYFEDDMGIKKKESKAIIASLMDALDGRVPMSPGSIYKCLALARIKRQMPEIKAFWNIGHSQRIALLPLKDNPEVLESTAIECYKDKLTYGETVKVVREEINLIPKSKRKKIRLTKIKSVTKALEKADRDVVLRGVFKEFTNDEIEELKRAAETLEKKLKTIKRKIEQIEGEKAPMEVKESVFKLDW